MRFPPTARDPPPPLLWTHASSFTSFELLCNAILVEEGPRVTNGNRVGGEHCTAPSRRSRRVVRARYRCCCWWCTARLTRCHGIC